MIISARRGTYTFFTPIIKSLDCACAVKARLTPLELLWPQYLILSKAIVKINATKINAKIITSVDHLNTPEAFDQIQVDNLKNLPTRKDKQGVR